MNKELFVSSTPHETEVGLVEDDLLAEVYLERENEYTLAGSIYKGRVTRVLPGMQSAFVDIGLERDAFLYVTDFLEEQEDQEEFEQVVNRAHSEAQPESSRFQTQAVQPLEAGETEAGERQSSGTDQAQGESAQFDRGPRRWRGRRGRRRGRFQENDLHPASAETSSSSDETAAPADGNEHEAIVLPGESLSKYRPAEAAEEEKHQQTLNSPADQQEDAKEETAPVGEAPVEQNFVPRSTERGASLEVLPGESISKYRNRDSEPDGSREASSRGSYSGRERSYGRSQSRWERPRRFEREPSTPEPVSSGPPVFALPGESLAKYRGKEELAAPASQPAPEIETASVTTTEPEKQEISRRDDAEPNVSYSSAEHSGVEERVEHVLSNFESQEHSASLVEHKAEEGGEAHHADAGIEAKSSEENTPVAHEFGAGVLEEEVIDEEESDPTPFGEHPDEDMYEELEEETLDAENAEQLVEAVREAHVNQRLGLNDGELPDAEDHPAGEEVASFASEEELHDHSEQLEAADLEDVNYQDADESFAEDQSSEDVPEEARAELRAPANTAAFQQRVERPERSQQDRFRRGRRGRPMRGRRNIQRESQPTISDLLKEGQEILVQIAKEPMAKKGARITSHIALPGRYLVYMPTVNHVGVSRKIPNEMERVRLKRTVASLRERENAPGGFIARTACAGHTEQELWDDMRYLLRTWTDVRKKAERTKSPELVHRDLDLVQRILRD